jgi:hypothetical protein
MILNNSTTPTEGFIQQTQIAYKGNSNWPQPGDPKYSMYIAIANRLMGDWMMDADVLWNSLFQERTYGPVIATQQAYDMDEDVFYLSDAVQILCTNGNIQNYRVVHPNARNDDQSGIGATGADFGLPLVYITGMAANQGSNLTINFVEPFQYVQNGVTTTTEMVGGTIEVGTYCLLPDLADQTDVIQIDNPYWLVWATAAELARNDPAKQDQVPNLVGLANQAYEKMITANQGNSFEQPNGPRYLLKQPGVTWEQF